jgi:hypothetical protein
MFTKPKFSKNQFVLTPDGKGQIIRIVYDKGVHWYGIEVLNNNKKQLSYYAESEVDNV